MWWLFCEVFDEAELSVATAVPIRKHWTPLFSFSFREKTRLHIQQQEFPQCVPGTRPGGGCWASSGRGCSRGALGDPAGTAVYLEAGWSLCQCADWVNTVISSLVRWNKALPVFSNHWFLLVSCCYLLLFISLCHLGSVALWALCRMCSCKESWQRRWCYICLCFCLLHKYVKEQCSWELLELLTFHHSKLAVYLNEQREGMLHRTKGRGYQWSWCLYASQNR